MTLNQGQQAAAQAVFQFLFSDDKEFIVSGPAGVGKTFLMQHIMKNIIRDYEDATKILGQKPVEYEAVLTATTNKATEVLAASTGFPAQTIHSFMNLKVVDNYKTGVSEITRTNQWTVHARKLIFIDEASMVDTKLHEFILAGTDKLCKIIYLGDHCQMAPVFETISPVYRKPKHFVLLTEPVRNADQPALVDLCSQLRHTVETLKFQPIIPIPGVIEYLDDTAASRFIDATFKDEDADSRILCYTNARVQEYNEYVRNLRGYPSTFTKGERLISNSAMPIGKAFIKVEEEVQIRDISAAPYDLQFNPNDTNVSLSVYDAELLLQRTGVVVKVMIPEQPDHLKALMKYYAKEKEWGTFYKLKNGFPDLRQRDAATVYKAQGSTYGSVFLDLGNIGKCTQNDQLARMLYVGASRAKSRLYLYGQLPKRLFSIGKTPATAVA